MSTLVMTSEEQKQIDSQVEQMMDWAKTRSAEAEQLALDSTRLLACTTDRLDRLQNQNFFKRCWNRFNGNAGEMERANVNDLIQMQKIAFRYVNMLGEQQLLMAHSLLSLKNNLISLAVKEEETRDLITMLAQRTLERFENLESRVEQLEISTNLQGWLLGLEERDYDEKFPTTYMRLFRVINDFYQIKNDNWNYNDLMFMRKAIRTVGINPKQKLSLNIFIDHLTDEIQSEGVGFDAYGHAIAMFVPEGIDNYSKFAIDTISSPVFVSMHGLKTQYMDRLDVVEALQDEMNIPISEALKRLLRRSIVNMNVNMNYEFPIAETAIEILGCIRLLYKLNNNSNCIKNDIVENENKYQIHDGITILDNISVENLFEAIYKGDVNKVNYQLENGISPNSINKNGDSVLKVSHRLGRQDIAELLLKHGASPLKKDILTTDSLNEEAILKEFASYKSDERGDLYIKNEKNSTKAMTKLISGLKSFGHGISINDVLIYYDATLFGGGDEGFILTKDRIYFKESFLKPDYERYKSITKVSMRNAGITIHMGERKTDIFCGIDSIKKHLSKAIQQCL